MVGFEAWEGRHEHGIMHGFDYGGLRWQQLLPTRISPSSRMAEVDCSAAGSGRHVQSAHTVCELHFCSATDVHAYHPPSKHCLHPTLFD
jgi:hypothetical protein